MTDPQEELIKTLFGPALHSISTMQNTDFGRQIGRGVKLREIAHKLERIPEEVQHDPEAIVRAYELKQPDEDKISLAFMPSGTVFRDNGCFFCVPRAIWHKLTGQPKG